MIKLWPLQGGKRQFITHATALTVVLMVVFYYFMYSTSALQYFTTPKTDPIITTLTYSEEPTCPEPLLSSASFYDPTKLAFLVETRPLPHLPALYAHMVSLLPPSWTFKFMGSNESIAHMRHSPTILRLESSGKLAMVTLPSNYTLTSRETVSKMFTDPYFYSHHLHPAENLLVFQPDSILCANAPRTIDDYLEYDWVGAPWSGDSKWGGNGGLSLRKVSRILLALSRESRKDNDGALEDLWLSDRLNKLPNAKMANATISKSFSVESVWDDAPLGYHVGWLGVHHGQIWDDEKQVEHVLEYCPEVKMILGMNLSNDKPKSVEKIDKTGGHKQIK